MNHLQTGTRGLLDSTLAALSSQAMALDPAGVITYLSPSWSARSALPVESSARVAVGENFLDVIHLAAENHAVPAILDGIRAVLIGRIDHFYLEYSCTASQEVRWSGMTVTPILGSEGDVLVVHSDVTPRRLMELRLQDKEARLSELRSRLHETELILATRAIVRGLWQECRAPLNAIAVRSESVLRQLQSGIAPVDIQPGLEEIVAASGRACRAAGAWCDAHAGAAADTVTFPLDKSLLDVVRLLQPELDAQIVTLDLQLDAELRVVTHDQAHLQLAVLMLLRRVIRAAANDPAGSARIVTLRCERSPGRTATITISSPASDLAGGQLFEPHGMEIAICRDVVEAHGSALAVTADHAHGITASFQVPTENT